MWGSRISRRADIRTGYGTSRYAARPPPVGSVGCGPNGNRLLVMCGKPGAHEGVGHPTVQWSEVVWDVGVVVNFDGGRWTGVRSCVCVDLDGF